MAYLEGIIEDVLINFGKFVIPTDFIILDFKADKQVPIILGRRFLETARALIDVWEGTLKMKVQNEKVVFDVYKAPTLTSQYKYLYDQCDWSGQVWGG